MIGVKPAEVVELLSISNRPFTAANDGIFVLSQEENLGKFFVCRRRIDSSTMSYIHLLHCH